jgi:hypothetical protein
MAQCNKMPDLIEAGLSHNVRCWLYADETH